MARKPLPALRAVVAPPGFYHDTESPGYVFHSVTSTEAGQGVTLEILQDGKISIQFTLMQSDAVVLTPAECDKLEYALGAMRNKAAFIYRKPKIRCNNS
jgi:hypothetical protein